MPSFRHLQVSNQRTSSPPSLGCKFLRAACWHHRQRWLAGACQRWAAVLPPSMLDQPAPLPLRCLFQRYPTCPAGPWHGRRCRTACRTARADATQLSRSAPPPAPSGPFPSASQSTPAQPSILPAGPVSCCVSPTLYRRAAASARRRRFKQCTVALMLKAAGYAESAVVRLTAALLNPLEQNSEEQRTGADGAKGAPGLANSAI